MGLAYFVVGPESSGTRMMCEAIIRSTGAEGSFTDGQPFDDLDFSGHKDTIVFRRSVPHGAIWYDLEELYRKMQKAGYVVKVVATDRLQKYLVPSQLKHGHVHTAKEAEQNIEHARREIDAFIEGKCVVPVFYESFVSKPECRRAVFSALGIKDPEMDFYDGDSQYGN